MKKSFQAAIILSALLATLAVSAVAGPGPGKSPRPFGDGDHDRRIKHVFVIVLENEGYDVTFGPNSKAPYLSQTLPTQGVLLTQYYGTGHVSLDNYIAMLSGQAATPQTRNDCTTYADYIRLSASGSRSSSSFGPNFFRMPLTKNRGEDLSPNPRPSFFGALVVS